MGIAKELIEQQAKLQTLRSTFEQHWAEIAPLVLSRQDDFFENNRSEGERRTRERFDDTAPIALDRGSAAIEGIIIPRQQKWHNIKLPDELIDDHEAQLWAEKLRDFLFRMRYASKANFASQAHEFVMSLLAFGTAVMSVEDIIGHGIRYKTCHLGEHYVMENSKGLIDVNYRKYRLTARQAKEKFEGKIIPQVEKHIEKNPAQKLEFLHVVMPDLEGDTEFPFVGYHIAVEDQLLIATGGFKTFPYIISRWVTAPNETYGRSPAMQVLSEIKMLNAIRKTDLKARHLAVDPPILAADQSTIRRLSMKPGAINYGSIDFNGRPLVQPYQSGSRIDVSQDTLEQSRSVINDAFFVTLFQILVENPQQTATEVLEKAQEKGTLLSPSAGRQMTEWLGPLIAREISLYEEYGIFEDDGILPMPDSVKEFDGEFDISYSNPLVRMQQSEQALATERTIQSLVPVAQIEPAVLEKVDWDAYADIMLEANGAPKRLFHDEDQLNERREAAAQQQQMQMMVEAAPSVAGAAKDMAHAQKLTSEV